MNTTWVWVCLILKVDEEESTLCFIRWDVRSLFMCLWAMRHNCQMESFIANYTQLYERLEKKSFDLEIFRMIMTNHNNNYNILLNILILK